MGFENLKFGIFGFIRSNYVEKKIVNLFFCYTKKHSWISYWKIPRVSVQGVESLWGDCRFIPADWGS